MIRMCTFTNSGSNSVPARIHPGPGAHVANAGFVVDLARRGQGAADGTARKCPSPWGSCHVFWVRAGAVVLAVPMEAGR